MYKKQATKVTAPLPSREGLGVGLSLPSREGLGVGLSLHSGEGLGVGLLFLFLISLSSCDDKDDGPYPSIVTELADCPTDAEGRMTQIVLDDDTRLTLSNPQTGLKANAVYRALAGYTLSDGQATLYSLTAAALLRDSTAIAQCDPTNVASLWLTRRYLNLHLLPKTQGQGRHTWGYIVDSIAGDHAYLRLHHRQGSDPASYTADQYASLPLDSIAANTITLRIATFSGTHERTFTR